MERRTSSNHDSQGKGKSRAMSIAATAVIAEILAIGPLTARLTDARTGQDPAQGTASPQRFDMIVREDFFSGFAGNSEALERGMRKCEEVLDKDPRNAEALVWHGSGLSFSAKKEFMAGNLEKGRQIQAQGVQEMNEAVAMKPEAVAVLIPRASVFLSAALHVPSPEVAKKKIFGLRPRITKKSSGCKHQSSRIYRCMLAANCWVAWRRHGMDSETSKNRADI